MLLAFVFILGLFVGSFLNVVVYRLHREESFVKGFSKCLFCGHRLYPKDLVPLVSFLYLRGKCRYCRHKIAKQYFLMELATAFGFTLIALALWKSVDSQIILANISPLRLSFSVASNILIFQTLVWWIFFSFLLIIFVYDLRYYLILDSVTIPAMILALCFNLFLGFSWQSLLIGALVGGGFFFLQFIVSGGKWIGGGDIRLGLLMGFILGWPQVLTALFVAYLLGSLFAICLLLCGKKHWGDKLPFGTFLSLATVIVMLYGDILVKWYWSLWI